MLFIKTFLLPPNIINKQLTIWLKALIKALGTRLTNDGYDHEKTRIAENN